WGRKTDEEDGNPPSCGTVACAVGHAGLDPWFRRRGLKMDLKQTWPLFKGDRLDWFTLERFFGLTDYETTGVFHATGYHTYHVTPRHVLVKIDRLLKKYALPKKGR